MSIARFWRETPHRYNLDGVRCTNCRTVYFPPRSVCPTCSKHRQSLGRFEPFQLSGEGELITFSIIHEPAEGFEMQVPYVLAMIQTPEGPRLTGQVVDIEPSAVRIGLKVWATFRKLREEGDAGVIHYGYKFAPIDDHHRAPRRGPEREPSEVPPASAGGTTTA